MRYQRSLSAKWVTAFACVLLWQIILCQLRRCESLRAGLRHLAGNIRPV